MVFFFFFFQATLPKTDQSIFSFLFDNCKKINLKCYKKLRILAHTDIFKNYHKFDFLQKNFDFSSQLRGMCDKEKQKF